MVSDFTRNLEVLASQHAKDREKALRGAAATETKKQRQLVQQQEQELKLLVNQQKKDCSREKDEMRKVLIKSNNFCSAIIIINT